MPTFLSTEWIAALARALAAVPLPAHGSFAPFAVRQNVTGAPFADDPNGVGRELAYRIEFSHHRIGVVVDSTDGTEGSAWPGPGDLVVTTDYDTAVALNLGELSAQEALESGRLDIRGRLEQITGARKMLVALEDSARELRNVTTYDPLP